MFAVLVLLVGFRLWPGVVWVIDWVAPELVVLWPVARCGSFVFTSTFGRTAGVVTEKAASELDVFTMGRSVETAAGFDAL